MRTFNNELCYVYYLFLPLIFVAAEILINLFTKLYDLYLYYNFFLKN